MSLGIIRDPNDYSPADIADFMEELLQHNDNSKNLLDDDGFLVTLLGACGSLSVGSQQVRRFLLVTAHGTCFADTCIIQHASSPSLIACIQ